MGQASVILIAAAEALGLTLAVYFFGIGMLLPLELALLAVGLGVRGTSLTLNFMACHIAFGIYVATVLFLTNFFFVNVLVGAGAVVLLVQNFGTRGAQVVTAPEGEAA